MAFKKKKKFNYPTKSLPDSSLIKSEYLNVDDLSYVYIVPFNVYNDLYDGPIKKIECNFQSKIQIKYFYVQSRT